VSVTIRTASEGFSAGGHMWPDLGKGVVDGSG
jgi:hypothetical protein